MRDRHLMALAGLIALAALLRFPTLHLQSFWSDEAVTVGLVRRGFWDMLRQIPDSESTPPLYYVLAWCWAKAFGTGEVGLRTMSALFGTAAVGAFYAAAAELATRRVALAVAALAAVNPLLVWYSQEARSYALLSLLGALSLLYFARALNRGDGRPLALWAVASALALATHYFAAFLVLPEAVWLALKAPRRRALPAVGAVAVAAGALAPLAVHQRSLDLTSFIRSTSPFYRLALALKQYLVGFDAPLEVPISALAAVVALAGIALAWVRLREEPGLPLAGSLALLAIGTPFLLALVGVDYFDSRNLIAAWLPCALVVVAGLALAAGRAGTAGLGVLAAVGVASVVGVALEPTWRRDDWRGAARELGPAREARAVVLTPVSGTKAFELYRRDTRPMLVRGLPVREIALVAKEDRSASAVHPAAPPRPRHPAIPGFAEVRREYAPTYTVLLFRAAAPVAVNPPGLQPYRLSRGHSAGVLVQHATGPVSGAAARGRRRGGG